jgi:hypothetical protein
MSEQLQLSPAFMAYYHLRHRRYEQCVDATTAVLKMTPLDQASNCSHIANDPLGCLVLEDSGVDKHELLGR